MDRADVVDENVDAAESRDRLVDEPCRPVRCGQVDRDRVDPVQLGLRTRTTIVRSSFRDATVPAGATPYYVVRALDVSKNRSGTSAEASVTPP